MGSGVLLPQRGQPAQGPDPSFKSAAIPNVVSFGFEKIDPPAAVYIQRDDVLQLEAITQVANDTIVITARLLIPLAPQPGQPDKLPAAPADPRGLIGPGYIQTIQQTLQVPSPRLQFNLSIQLMEGYLLSVTVVGSNTRIRGGTFVRVFINRGIFAFGTPNATAMLLTDYVTQFNPVGWPGGRQLNPSEGPGFYQTYNPANPAAGADLSLSSNSSGRVRVNTFAATFTASAGAANRIVSFFFSPTGGASLFYVVQDTVAVTASQTVRYSLASGATNVRGAGAGTVANPIDVTLPLPSPAIGGISILMQSVTQNIQAADQWSNILMDTEEWLEQV